MARSYFGFIRLYLDDAVEDHDTTTPNIREMGDNNHSESDNIDMRRLHLKANLRVVSAVNPRDMTLTSASQKHEYQ